MQTFLTRSIRVGAPVRGDWSDPSVGVDLNRKALLEGTWWGREKGRGSKKKQKERKKLKREGENESSE